VLRLCVALLLTAGAVLAGCGSDDSEDGATTSISKDEFIERGDQFCEQFRDAADPLERKGDRAIEQRDFETLANLTDQLTALAEETLEQFRSLPVPEGEEAAVSGYLDVQSQQIVVADQLGEAFGRTDVGEITALGEEVQSLSQESDELAQSIGFTVCGRE
jgi:excinuclease UvrABC nuclease subunit